MTAQLGNPPNGALPPGATPAQLVSVWPPQNGALIRLELGNGEGQFNVNGAAQNGSAGVDFAVASQPPANDQGSFQFVQVITKTSYDLVTNPSQNGGVAVSKGNNGVGLDNWYPYAAYLNAATGQPFSPLQAVDYPSLTLALSNGAPVEEALFQFTASMYLMWDPALPGAGPNPCAAASNVPTKGLVANPQTSTCAGSIPVPLGYVTWGFTGDTINTLNPNAPASANATGSANRTGWVLLNCTGTSPFQQGGAYLVTSYPTWTSVATNN